MREPHSLTFALFVLSRLAELIAAALRPVYHDTAVMHRARDDHAITEQLWVQVVARLRRKLLGHPHDTFKGSLDDFRALITKAAAAATGDAVAMSAFSEHLLPMLLSTAASDFGPQLEASRALAKTADLRHPHSWYPVARAMKRRIVFHAGPTNSGKTYNAIRALKDSWSGVYCGPLRLLALEVFESLNMDGVATSLLTGQERREMPFAKHVSCTVEMVDVETLVDVAVIDEIQMIGDDSRGASWTRALLGLPAREIHVCGDPAAIPAVTALAAITGDELDIRTYQRMTSITVESGSLGADYSRIQEGDAIVAFSRKDIYAIRKTVERKTAHKCCVVYGSLPPETRSAQARLFNDPHSGYRVLVASDAIGMGLNLNIRRVVFHTMTKFDGVSTGLLAPSAAKQIAGRAGRRGSIYPAGYSTTLQDEDLPYLRECMSTPSEAINKAGLFPNPEQLLAFSALLPRGTPLAKVVEQFVASCQLEGPYFMCRIEDIKTTAALLQPFPISFEQRCMLCLAPANLRNLEVRSYFLQFIEQYVAGQPVKLGLQLPVNEAGYLVRNIESLEAKAQALDMYLWLAHKLGVATFPDLQEAVTARSVASQMLETALQKLSEETKEANERRMSMRKAQSRVRAAKALRAAREDNAGAGAGAALVDARRADKRAAAVASAVAEAVGRLSSPAAAAAAAAAAAPTAEAAATKAPRGKKRKLTASG